MKSTPYSLSLTAVNLIARGSYFLVFLLIGNSYGSTITTDTVFLMYAPVAIAATVIAGIAEIVGMPFAYRAQADHCRTAFRRLLTRKAVTATLSLAPLVLIASFAMAGTIGAVALLLMPIPALAAISGIFASQLNAAGHFRVAALGPVYGAAVAGISLVAIPVSAAGLALTLLCYEIGRATSMYLHGTFVLRNDTDASPENAPRLMAQALRGMLHQGIGSLLVAINPLVDMLFAKTLSAGDVSSVEYANRMWVAIPLLFSGPLMMFHSRASAAASRGKLSLQEVDREALRLGLAATAVGLILMWLTAQWLIDWLYGWGRMDVGARDSLTNLFIAYLLGTGPYVASLIYIRTFSAATQISFVTKAAAMSVVLNAGLDWLLIRYFGLTGLGLATSASYLAVAVFLYLALRRLDA
jgi:peptidoglycan biosynthesis protein MviN/MurJ (putative lipid II flippase)